MPKNKGCKQKKCMHPFKIQENEIMTIEKDKVTAEIIVKKQIIIRNNI